MHSEPTSILDNYPIMLALVYDRKYTGGDDGIYQIQSVSHPIANRKQVTWA